jgi:PAS domain S-box-containing protein
METDMDFDFKDKTREELILELKSEISKREKLTESETRYKELFENSMVGIFRTRISDGLLIEANSKVAELAGMKLEDMVGKLNTSDFYKDIQQREEALKILAQYGELNNFEVDFIVPRENKIRTVSISSKIYPEKGYSEGTVIDISELTQQKEFNKKLAAVVKQTNDGIAIADLDGTITFVNDTWTKMHGYDSADTLFGKNISMFHTEKQIEKFVIPANKLALKNGFHKCEIGHVRKDGTTFFTQMTCTILKDENNKPYAMVGNAMDITEKKIDEAHTEFLDKINTIIINSLNLDEMFNNILDMMLNLFDCDRIFLLFPVDPQAKTYKLPVYKAKPKWSSPDTEGDIPMAPETSKLLSDLLETIEPLAIGSESQFEVPDSLKKIFYVKSSLSIVLKPKQGKPWLLGMDQCSHDRNWTTTEKKLFQNIAWRVTDGLTSMLFQEELSKTRNYLSNIIDSMPSILVGVDNKGKVTQWNDAAQNLADISKENALGQPLDKVFPRMAEEMEKIKTAIQTREVQSSLKKAYKRKETSRYENVTIYPLVTNGVRGAVIRVDDITEQMHIKEMMLQSEKMRSVGGLAAGMAHEINNPLAGLMQTSQNMRNRLANPNISANLQTADELQISFERIHEFMEKRGIFRMLDVINDSGKRIADIVGNMLSFSRTTDSTYSTHDIVGLLDKTLCLVSTSYNLKNQYDFKDIIIVKEYEETLPPIPCNSGRIQQVLLNILNNGAHAMSIYHKKCKASGINADPQRFILRILKESESIRIEIEDNGSGIDEEIQKQIFEPFFTTKPENEGTGLGLSISYFIIVENHGGTLIVKSKPGKGSNFIITLPIEKAETNPQNI